MRTRCGARAGLVLALLGSPPASAQYVPDAPPFVRADPGLGRPVDQYPSGPYGDPSLSRQGPLATPHPMFRDPARDVFTDRSSGAPMIAPMRPMTSPLASPVPSRPVAVMPRSGPPVVLTQRKGDDGAPGAVSTMQAVSTIQDVARALSRCWRPPAGAVEATIRLAFARDGRLVGTPVVTYVKVKDAAMREAVRASALAARACSPLRFTAGAGSAMAGRIFAIRMIALPSGVQTDI